MRWRSKLVQHLLLRDRSKVLLVLVLDEVVVVLLLCCFAGPPTPTLGGENEPDKLRDLREWCRLRDHSMLQHRHANTTQLTYHDL